MRHSEKEYAAFENWIVERMPSTTFLTHMEREEIGETLTMSQIMNGIEKGFKQLEQSEALRLKRKGWDTSLATRITDYFDKVIKKEKAVDVDSKLRDQVIFKISVAPTEDNPSTIRDITLGEIIKKSVDLREETRKARLDKEKFGEGLKNAVRVFVRKEDAVDFLNRRTGEAKSELDNKAVETLRREAISLYLKDEGVTTASIEAYSDRILKAAKFDIQKEFDRIRTERDERIYKMLLTQINKTKNVKELRRIESDINNSVSGTTLRISLMVALERKRVETTKETLNSIAQEKVNRMVEVPRSGETKEEAIIRRAKEQVKRFSELYPSVNDFDFQNLRFDQRRILLQGADLTELEVDMLAQKAGAKEESKRKKQEIDDVLKKSDNVIFGAGEETEDGF